MMLCAECAHWVIALALGSDVTKLLAVIALLDSGVMVIFLSNQGARIPVDPIVDRCIRWL
jgi:hypothetical protein